MPRSFVARCAAALCAVALPASLWAGVEIPCGVGFEYPSFPPGSPLALNGSATVSGGVLVLTPDAPGQAGSAWHAVGRASIDNGFETTFTFVLDGTADGIALVLQPWGLSALGSGGSGLGYSGIFGGVAVEIDTFCFGGEFACDHISIQTVGVGPLDHDDSASLAHAVLPVDVNDGQPHTLRIVYASGLMLVYFDGDSQPLLVAGIDLNDLPGGSIGDGDNCLFIGFTGGTGAAAAAQSVLSWSFTDSPDPPVPPCNASFDLASFDTPSHFALVGSAAVEEGAIRLTEGSGGEAGAAWYRLARADVSSGFVTEFTFVIDGESDGIAFVLQSESLGAIGGPGSGLGYAANNGEPGITASLAVEFDTFCFPGEFDCDHISVQANPSGENQFDDSFSLASHVLSFDLNDGKPHVARIEYTPGSLTVTVNGEGLSTGLLLENLDILDADGCVYIGFTGATGGVAAEQRILSWSFNPGEPGCVPVGIASFLPPFAPVPAGQAIEITVVPSGTPPFTVEWRRNSVLLTDEDNVSGATTGALTVFPTNTAATGQYDVVITNDCGGVSTGVFITVAPACPGDADGNGMVNFADITAVLVNFIAAYGFGTGIGDANGDGVVNFADITSVLVNFGNDCT